MASLPAERVERLEKLAGYRIGREISRSSIASVYEGEQPSLGRKVLIKILHPQLASDPEIRARFEREAQALARIKHKNIVHVYDYRSDAEAVLLVSEWIAHGSLEEYLREHGPIDERHAAALALDVLEGLAAAHEAGIIHRDIKPANLLIAAGGSIKITDFGLAQFEDSPHLTQQGVVMGTPAYAAPEVISGRPPDARCDLYSLGVTLYELLTGTNPFRAENLSETLNRVLSLKPDPLEGVSPEMGKFLASLLEKRPERRPATTRDALEQARALAEMHG
ncbi:MAG TPA: serine/threonine protein kinase, partial [Bacteroidetes bacterium]|nr:serine/threonine protein kinase [Bacteroidota bacterium]